jgi:cyclophilin family peptidyl-prolyl cis-trans isomerase
LLRFGFATVVASLMLCHASLVMAADSKATPPPPPPSKGKTVSNPVVIIETSKGTMEAELWEDKAPITVKNFLAYADEKFFDNTIFHRVIPGFMIQGGGMTADMKEKQTKAPIKNEANSELKNVRGTLAMARTNVVDSATSQFFINSTDNDFLNHTGTGPQTFGYAVFGKVTKETMPTIDEISKVATKDVGFHQNVPVEPVVIKSIRRK